MTREARLSRGAFYSHFRSLDELWAVVAAELASAIEDFSPAGFAELIRSRASPPAARRLSAKLSGTPAGELYLPAGPVFFPQSQARLASG